MHGNFYLSFITFVPLNNLILIVHLIFRYKVKHYNLYYLKNVKTHFTEAWTYYSSAFRLRFSGMMIPGNRVCEKKSIYLLYILIKIVVFHIVRLYHNFRDFYNEHEKKSYWFYVYLFFLFIFLSIFFQFSVFSLKEKYYTIDLTWKKM